MIVAASLTLVLWLDPGPPDPTAAVRRELERQGFELGSQRWSRSGMAVFLARERRAHSDEQLFDALGALGDLPGVIAAGELVGDDGDRLRFFEGRVVLHFREAVREEEARAAGAALGLALVERASRDGTRYRYQARRRHADILALQRGASRLRSIERLAPALHQVTNPATVPIGTGRYHRIPRGRNRLTVLLGSATVTSDVRRVIAEHGGTIEDPLGDRDPWIDVRFARAPPESGEGDMEAALARLLALREVRRAGPTVFGGPRGFLTNQLVVRFAGELDREAAAPILEHGPLVEVRELPYIENGFLFRYETPSYHIYDIAEELIRQGRAVYAIPNLMTVNVSTCGDDSCFKAPHQEYLRVMNLCEPRKPITRRPAEWKVRLAVLDEGASGVGLTSMLSVCERLYVETAIDFESMSVCQPDHPSNWCVGCGTLVGPWEAGHGNGVSLIAAATAEAGDPDLAGVAPGLKLINARRWLEDEDLMTDVAFADALWWLAGGNPKWCRDGGNYKCTSPTPPYADECSAPAGVHPCDESDALPAALTDQQRADIINLSFAREDFLATAVDCSASEICALVCNDPTDCGVIAETAAAIHCPDCGHGMRDGGAVLVVSAGNKVNNESGSCDGALCYPQGSPPPPSCFMTDLAELDSSLAVGSVRWDGGSSWLPYYPSGSSQCLIHHRGSFVDMVAPFGGFSGMQMCVSCGYSNGAMYFGESSGAAAAASGIAALMLQRNSDLTAAQVQCILRETADPGPWSAMSGGPVPCDFTSLGGTEHSPCMGRGMADACSAVAAAVACKNPASPDCPSDCFAPLESGVEPAPAEPAEEEAATTVTGAGTGSTPTRITLAPSSHRVVSSRLSSLTYDLLRCLAAGGCTCADGMECLALDVINPGKKTLRDVQAELCFDERCWPLGGTVGKWKAKTTVRIPLAPQPGMLGYLLLEQPATIRLAKGSPK